MPFSGVDIKRIYYYVLCAMAFFVLMWGTIDLASSSIGLINFGNTVVSVPEESSQGSTAVSDKTGQFVDSYYQSKMLFDRFWDSLARVIISSIIFAYCRFTVNRLEQKS